MILRIIIDNLYSFGQQTEFNMFTNKSQRHLEHKRFAGKIAYLKMAAIYGANGAGKSNMIKALELLQSLVKEGNIPVFVDNLKFKLDKECLDRCSSVSVEFVVDEIERSIHPAVIKELVRLIAAYKEMNGQLVFSTHETCLLDQDILRTDEIWFAQKNVLGSTDLYSLSDFNVHATANVENGYLNGRYGGIPFKLGKEILPFVKEEL